MAFTGECLTIFTFLALPFLYEKSRSFRYYFKFFVYYSFIIITSLVLIPIMIWKCRDVQNLILASRICRHISRVLGLHWEIKGREYLEKDEPCVVVANHQSSLDVLGVIELVPIMHKCAIVAKRELLYAWPFGLAAWLCGLIFIDRLNSDTSRQAINDSVKQLKKDKAKFPNATFCWKPLVHVWVKLWVFPEGTRKNTGEIHDFKKGAFHAAVNGQIPLLPVVFSQFYFTQKGSNKSLEIGRILVTVLPPISTEGLTAADIPRLMADTRTSMIQAFEESNRQLRMTQLANKID